jgi:RNA polymerase sigma factor (sigma-70 family)
VLAEVDPRVTYDHESETAQALSDFDAIVTAYEPRVRSALRMGRAAPVDTDDLVQEVFTRLLIRLRGPGRICVGAWLWRVSRNVAIDASRRRVPVPVADDVLDRQQGEGLDTYALRADLRDHVRTILAEMPERQQQALIAMLKAGPRDRGSCVEVAAVLGVSVEAAESLLSRGRRHMRAELARLGLVDAGRLGGLALLGPLMGHLLRTARRVTAGRAAAVVFVVTAGAIGAHHAASSPPRPLDHSSGGSAQPSPPRAGRPSASAIGVVALSSAPRAAGPLSSTASPEGAASSGATLGVPSQRSLIALIASAPLLASAQNQVTGLPVGVSPSDPAAPLGPAGAALASAQARLSTVEAGLADHDASR